LDLGRNFKHLQCFCRRWPSFPRLLELPGVAELPRDVRGLGVPLLANGGRHDRMRACLLLAQSGHRGHFLSSDRVGCARVFEAGGDAQERD
jgi:hypothetical protein